MFYNSYLPFFVLETKTFGISRYTTTSTGPLTSTSPISTKGMKPLQLSNTTTASHTKNQARTMSTNIQEQQTNSSRTRTISSQNQQQNSGSTTVLSSKLTRPKSLLKKNTGQLQKATSMKDTSSSIDKEQNNTKREEINVTSISKQKAKQPPPVLPKPKRNKGIDSL